LLPCRCHSLRLKCTKFDFGWGSAPDPAGGAYSAPPDLLAGFEVPTSKGRDGKEWEGGCYGDGVTRRNKGLTKEERGGEGMEGDNGIGPPSFRTWLPPQLVLPL